MKRAMRIVLTLLLAMMLPLLTGSVAAQAIPSGRAPATAEGKKFEKGFALYESFEGSSSADGQVMDLNSTLGYNFSRLFGVDVGVPVFFVRSNLSTSTSGQRTANGLGNVYTDVRFIVPNPLLNFSSTLTGAAPTGDTTKGLSTGRATFDWSNHLDRGIGRLTPFLEAGVGNSISDTRFFKRPFITLGPVAHFEAGTDIGIWHSLSFTVSAYDVLPWGQQRVFSRVRRQSSSGSGTARRGRVFENQTETVGTADLVRDNGFSAGFNFSPVRLVNLDVGYTRSVRFALDTISFGIGVNLSSLVHHRRGP